ncbi:MAG: type II toxin-antitoxin system YafQ family toxin [Pyramidobacter sp.]|nr:MULTISPECIES: type II toxin-antitoxin system YafQ family toxin [unclassified Pyramidobacter]MCI7403238.1 type II toxin-antitoxin system YafQ family toxin [Pyramidobacter sp.]MDY2648609.1 type II toxin-antitoxin system YafQ family toxin [Pyramidobacter porci]MDY3212599.1 type II toxin-antitoxin system YafQ family toxin [Pyramidobacter sp.]MDY4032824.1 type II toxin-antitoxin system YafQ family toxin [Pyramidobacter sp.]
MLHVEFTAQFRKDRKRMEKRGDVLGLVRTGSHADLFDK